MKIILLTLVLVSSITQASEFNPYVGLNMGGSQLNGVNNEQSKTGYLLGVKGLGSWNFDLMVLDAGVGYYLQEVSNQSVWIKTKTATVDLDVRYKLTDSSQLGMGSRSDVGTDNTGREYVGSSSQSNVLFAKYVMMDVWNKYPIRYEVGMGASVGQSRGLTTAFVGIQMSLPESKKTVSVAKKTEPQTQNFKVDLKVAKVLFDTNKFEISSDSESKLVALAQFLVKNNSKWDRIKIGGHTDVRGDNQDNKTLSQDRADAVLKVLVSNGVSESKLSALGYGSRVPETMDNSDDGLQKNRRTEIEFFGVDNRMVFNQSVMTVLKGKVK